MDWIYFSSGAAVVVILLIIVAVRKYRNNHSDYSEPEPAEDVAPKAPVITEPMETTLTHVGKDKVSRSIWLSPNGKFYTKRVAASGRKYNDYLEGDAMIDCQAEIISTHPDIAAYFGWM